MKKNILILFTIICGLHISSCDDMLDNIQPYLDEGEKVYVGKVDSLTARSGKNRILLQGLYLYGLTQKKCIISWVTTEDEKKSLELDVVRKEPIDKFEVMIEDLEEGQYEFSIRTYDSKGNSSIVSVIDGYAYGETYQSNLVNRKVEKITQQDGNLIISWRTINTALSCEVYYTDLAGKEIMKEIPASEMETQLSDCDTTKSIRWRTVYLPEKTAIDKFYTEYAEQIIVPN